MSKFAGFASDALKFFRAICKNNNREWYLRNKERYQASVQAPA